MATPDTQLCTLCKEDTINNDAVTWCTDCETFLCVECDKHHSRIKASRQHKTLPSNEYQKLPDYILKTVNICPDHDQRYELYCPNHSTACCFQCFTEKHQNCKDLKQLCDILKDVKSSASASRLEQDLRDVKENCDSIIAYLQDRLSTILKQKTKGIGEIQYMRKSLNEHLDKLEQKMLKELDMEHTKLKAKTEILINLLSTKSSYIKTLEEDYTKIKNFATELQTFIGLNEIAEKTTKEAEYLEKLKQVGDLDKANLEVYISSDVKTVLPEIKSFGGVLVTSVQCGLKLKKKVECQALISVPIAKTIDEINPVLKQKITLPKMEKQCGIIGCQILPNGRILFVDYSGKQLILYNGQSSYNHSVISLKDSPYDVCHIKDNTSAATVFDRGQVLMIDVDDEKITNTINRGKGIKCYGIDSNGDTIVVAEKRYSKGSITILDLEGKELRYINVSNEQWAHVVMFKRKFYCTSVFVNKMLCLQDNGDKLWETGIADFNSSRGIAIDEYGIIYVASFNNNSIIIISPDDQRSRVILSERDGIQSPIGISIDRKTSTLLVSNRNDGFAFMFQI